MKTKETNLHRKSTQHDVEYRQKPLFERHWARHTLKVKLMPNIVRLDDNVQILMLIHREALIPRLK